MEFYLLNDDFENIGILECVLEAQVIHRFHAPGEITVKLPHGIRVSSKAAYIYDPESLSCAVIEKVVCKHGESITLSGRKLECLLERQIVRSGGVYMGSVENAVKFAVERYAISSRAVPNLEFAEFADIDTEGIVDLEWMPLSEWLYMTLKPYGAAFTVTLDTTCNRLYFSLVQGSDRTYGQGILPPVVFIEDDGTLLDGSYSSDLAGYANTAYVIGNDGTFVTVPEVPPSGLSRREVAISAKDIYPNSFETEEEYKAALYARGLSKLPGYGARIYFEGSDSGRADMTLGRDYFLGDLCEVESVGV